VHPKQKALQFSGRSAAEAALNEFVLFVASSNFAQAARMKISHASGGAITHQHNIVIMHAAPTLVRRRPRRMRKCNRGLYDFFLLSRRSGVNAFALNVCDALQRVSFALCKSSVSFQSCWDSMTRFSSNRSASLHHPAMTFLKGIFCVICLPILENISVLFYYCIIL
jgi:hypothetical protein